ncbi:MAG TPA: HEAT repeat domain-containing protein [Bryobacteraceae bacterium]|nr:HEAT repeat domain-containing protein [Bryobacteraceae bacterium]
MRLALLRLLIPILAPALLGMQAPRIGVIDFYGARKTPPAELRKALGIREGSPLPGARAALEQRLEAVPNVVRARLSAACCEAGNAILYVGIEERGAAHFDLHAAPDQELYVPTDIADAYQNFLDAVSAAARAGVAAEDLSQGHSLISDPSARGAQERFIPLAEQHAAELRAVIRGAADPQQRAIAAYVIGYHPEKPRVVDDVIYALRDADETVRANAIRSLAALAVYAAKNPQTGLKVPATWLVEMLNSLEWSDRNNAAVTLVTLTESRNPGLLAQLKERALPSLLEMAAWRHLPHALPAYILVGRIAGVSEPELRKAWSEGRRDSIIRRAGGASAGIRSAPPGRR